METTAIHLCKTKGKLVSSIGDRGFFVPRENPENKMHILQSLSHAQWWGLRISKAFFTRMKYTSARYTLSQVHVVSFTLMHSFDIYVWKIGCSLNSRECLSKIAVPVVMKIFCTVEKMSHKICWSFQRNHATVTAWDFFCHITNKKLRRLRFSTLRWSVISLTMHEETYLFLSCAY